MFTQQSSNKSDSNVQLSFSFGELCGWSLSQISKGVSLVFGADKLIMKVGFIAGLLY